MPKSIRRFGLWPRRISWHFCLTVAALMPAAQSLARDQILIATQERLLETLEQVLLEQQMEIVDQATTERFALVYATHGRGAHCTITIRQMPADPTRAKVTVLSDSPVDRNLEQALLRDLESAL